MAEKSSLRGDTSDTTMPESEIGRPIVVTATALALCVIWCPTDLERIGEVLIVPPGTADQRYVFGRGRGLDDAGVRRLLLSRDRPTGLDSFPLVSLPRVSRVQLEIAPEDDLALVVRNVGRLSLQHNGREVDEARVVPGDVLRLGQQIMFLCGRRPVVMCRPGCEKGALARKPHAFGDPDVQGIIGESPAVWALRDQIAFAGAQSEHVLVVGESGTGKELVANAVHARSSRTRRAMVSRNAVTFPESLVDAELFGNVKNYPNPGTPERKGLIGEANGSSLLLDEVGELPISLQAHLLRVLDSGEYQRLGEANVRRTDLRMIAVTNRPEGLKHDLAARFPLKITVCGLNDRREDIPLLARHFLRSIIGQSSQIAGRLGVADANEAERGMSHELMRRLVQHRYTTHVRELRVMLWRCLENALQGTIDWVDAAPQGDPVHEPVTVRSAPAPRSRASALVSPSTDPRKLRPEDIQICIDQENGVLERAWQKLGLSSRHALRRLIQKHGIVVKRE